MPDLPIFIDHQPRDHILSGSNLVRDYYTDRVGLEEDLPTRAVAMICVEGQVFAIGAFRRGMKITNWDRRYEISSISSLDSPVSLELVQSQLAPQVKSYFAPAKSRKAALPKGTSREFIRVISAISANAGSLIERSSGSPAGLDQMSERRRQLLAEERDMFGIIAELSGLGREAGSPGRSLLTLGDQVDPSLSYLESLHEAFDRQANDEDGLVAADMGRFDGFMGERARRNSRGILIPHTQGKIAVMNTNKNRLENVYGCDLIYYNVPRSSAILVQYKRMKHDDSIGRWIYYGDKNLLDEIDHMQEIVPDGAPDGVAQYRLNAELHYLKIVRPSDYDGRSADLMEGMYIPLGLVDLMLSSMDSESVTADGNLMVMWRDDRYPTQRHLNNTQFTELFRDGWIGACGTTSDMVKSIVDRYFDADELVTLVVDEYERARRN
jgi:hypothetical protein